MAIIRLAVEEEEADTEIPVIPPEVELQKAENPWKPICLDPDQALIDENEALEKRVLGLLNKVAPQNMSVILGEFLPIVGADPQRVALIVGVVFTKAIQEPLYCHVYSQLCAAVVQSELELGGGESSVFRDRLLAQCREFFEGVLHVEAQLEQTPMSPSERAYQQLQKKQLVKGNIRFIGELFKCGGVVGGSLICTSAEFLLSSISGDEWVLECLATLLTHVGAELESQSAWAPLLDGYMGRVAAALAGPALSARLRFLLRNLLDLRSNGWRHRLDEYFDGPITVTR